MSPETKQVILKALTQYRGDDYERAKQAFDGLSAEQMQKQHGFSGRTKQSILDGYRQHVEAVKRAIAEVSRP